MPPPGKRAGLAHQFSDDVPEVNDCSGASMPARQGADHLAPAINFDPRLADAGSNLLADEPRGHRVGHLFNANCALPANPHLALLVIGQDRRRQLPHHRQLSRWSDWASAVASGFDPFENGYFQGLAPKGSEPAARGDLSV